MANVENLPPHTIRHVLKELAGLQSSPPEGVKVVFSEADVTSIEALIDGPAGTPYDGGVFRVKLVLSDDFPRSPPRGYFITRVFHPNVATNGEICVNTLKKDWKPELGIKHVLLTIKCLLIVPNAESALNEEAGMMLLERYEDYCRRARMMTQIHAQKSVGASHSSVISSASSSAISSSASSSSGAPCAKSSGQPSSCSEEHSKPATVAVKSRRNLKRL